MEAAFFQSDIKTTLSFHYWYLGVFVFLFFEQDLQGSDGPRGDAVLIQGGPADGSFLQIVLPLVYSFLTSILILLIFHVCMYKLVQ